MKDVELGSRRYGGLLMFNWGLFGIFFDFSSIKVA